MLVFIGKAKSRKPKAEFITVAYESITARAGVAERFRRQPAELLYEGSTPFPGSTEEKLLILRKLMKIEREF